MTPFDPGVVARIAAGLSSTLRSAADWFGPGESLAPVAPAEVEGRAYDFPAQFNIQTRPRVYESTQFEQLRYLADSCELIRMVIETRKDQLTKLKWTIRYRDAAQEEKRQAAKKPKKKPAKLKPTIGPDGQVQKPEPSEIELEDPTPIYPEKDLCDQVQEFLQFPDRRHDWATWYRIILEDLFVLDAPTLYVRRTKGGDVWGFEPVDGATIAPLIDATGRLPFDGPAYMQTLKGLPAVTYTRDELVYAPRNARAHKVYGFSPVEQIQWLSNLIIRRELHKLRYYTDGSTPDLIMRVPEGWTPDQVKAYKAWWDKTLRGNSGARRGTMFVVTGSEPIDTKEKALKDEFDEWLARLVCYAFSLSPQAFVKETNRATAQTQQEQSLQEGLEPLKLWTKSLMDQLLIRANYPSLEFVWDEEESVDPLEAAQIAEIYVRARIKEKNEVREELSLPPIDGLDDPEP
jgi:hypothetical protein